MQFRDIFKTDVCRDLFKSVNCFSSHFLKGYNDQIESLGFYARPKDIFDYIWGTVELSAVEICLLDSPLIQRLRNIKQLGFAHYVYCNADYSRFAHTIGVVEISGRMANVVTRNLKQPILNNQTFYMREVIRLAAIFHDCGHMFYSHVSEKFFTDNPNCKYNQMITKALSYFNEQISTRAAFHEMLSVMIVNSDEVYRLFSLIAKHMEHSRIRENEETDLLIDYISGLIVGTAVDKNILPYSMIIKGAIDADRMDYLSRDSSTTKVPLAVDIGRLINKVTVVKINDYQPSRVWNDHTTEDYPYQSMAIQYSARRLIGQLSMARSIFYQSIYFHHKKLTAEAMFRKACEYIFELTPDMDFSQIMSFHDHIFNEYFAEVMVPPKYRDDSKCRVAYDILIRIRDRNLYKRVASFSQDVLDSVENYVYESFVTNVIEDQASEAYSFFVKRLTEEYYKVLDCLNKQRPADPPAFMFIEANWINKMTDDIPVDFGNAPYRMSSQIYKETPTFGEENRQKEYYLVTDQDERELVYAALERVLYLQYKIRIQENAYTCAKFTSEQLDKIKGKLLEDNYYNDSLCLLSDRIIKQLYDSQLFRNVANKYRSFIGVRQSRVTESSLFQYLRQYLLVYCNKEEIRYLLDGVLRLLMEATFIDREFFSGNVSSLMKKILEKGYKNNYMVKLGGAFDSANRLTYYFNDIKEKREFNFVETVPDTLKIANNSDSCIVFFDDGAYSGKQVVSIFQELMGVPVEQRETNETHTKELDEESKRLIQSSRIILAYICFNKNSEKWILDKLIELGIGNVEIVFERDLSQKVFSRPGEIFSSEKQCEVVKSKLEEIGYQVQRSSKVKADGKTFKERWDEKRVKNSALGYNDAQQMVVFEFNVPTYTLTPFWQNGSYQGTKWKGLFQRTDK